MSMAPSPSHTETLRSQIRARIDATPAPAISPQRRITAVLAIPLVSVAAAVLASLIVYGRPAAGLELGLTSSAALLWALSLILIVTLTASAVGLWRGRSGLGAGVATLAITGVLVTPVYALIVLFDAVHVRNFAVASVAISPWGLRCLMLAGFVGLTALACLGIALRHAAPVATRLRGAALGAVAGAWAGLAVFAFCPSGDLQHLTVGHVFPVAALTCLGAAALGRLLRP